MTTKMKLMALGLSMALFTGCSAGDDEEEVLVEIPVSVGDGEIYWADNTLFGVVRANKIQYGVYNLYDEQVGAMDANGFVMDNSQRDLGYCADENGEGYTAEKRLVGECKLDTLPL